MRELSFDEGGYLHTQKKKNLEVRLRLTETLRPHTTIIEVQGMLNDL